MPSHRQSNFRVSDRGVNKAGCVETCDVVLMTGKAIATPERALRAVHMHRSGFLPERPLRTHGSWTGRWEHHAGKKRCGISYDGSDVAGLSGGSCSKLEEDLRPHVSGSCCQSRIPDIKAFAFLQKIRIQILRSESGTDCRNNLFSDLQRQALSDLFRPTLFLTGILRERFGAFACQLGCKRTNIPRDRRFLKESRLPKSVG